MIARTALLAVMEAEPAYEALSRPWTARFYGGERPAHVAWRGLCAILEPDPTDRNLSELWREGSIPSRAEAVGIMAARQDALEQLAQCGTVLAAVPGQTLSPSAARLFLAGHGAMLRDGLARHAGLEQYEITVRWQPAAALRRFASGPELADVISADGVVSDTAALAERADRLRRRLGAGFVQQLRSVLVDGITQSLDGQPDLLVSQVGLVRQDARLHLDTALERIDAVWPEGLSIRLVGPSPAQSFAALVLDRPTRREIQRAEVMMDISAQAQPSEIRAAVKAGMLRAGAPMPGDDGLAASRIAAMRLLRTIADVRHALSAEGLEADPWDIPLAHLRREGDVGWDRRTMPQARENVA